MNAGKGLVVPNQTKRFGRQSNVGAKSSSSSARTVEFTPSAPRIRSASAKAPRSVTSVS